MNMSQVSGAPEEFLYPPKKMVVKEEKSPF